MTDRPFSRWSAIRSALDKAADVACSAYTYEERSAKLDQIARDVDDKCAARESPTPPPAPRVVVTEAMAKITAALAVVGDLCEGKRQWIMSIPARPDHDPDLVIAGALRSAKRILTALADADAGGAS
jgi:hypothetical protein